MNQHQRGLWLSLLLFTVVVHSYVPDRKDIEKLYVVWSNHFDAG